MAYRIKVSGIYNLETLNLLKMEGIAHFGVDLRPRSFNFLQHYVTLNIVKKLDVHDNLFLHFQDESANVISKFLSDINELILINQTHILNQNIKLEFSGQFNGNLWNEFNQPFYIKWSRDFQLADVRNLNQCKGISLSVTTLRDYQSKGEFYRFIDQLLKLKTHRENFEIILNLEEETYPALLNQIELQNESIQAIQEMILHCSANFINVTIGPSVEEQYRRPNYSLLKKIVNLSSNMMFSE